MVTIVPPSPINGDTEVIVGGVTEKSPGTSIVVDPLTSFTFKGRRGD